MRAFAALVIGVGATCGSFLGFAQKSSLVVKVDGIREAQGNVVIALFDNESDYMVKFKYVTELDAKGDNATAVFENIEPGEYAICVIHDLDKNGTLNKNRFGIPTEGFGFSNNELGLFGPPSFKKAKVSCIGGRQPLSIRLRYL